MCISDRKKRELRGSGYKDRRREKWEGKRVENGVRMKGEKEKCSTQQYIKAKNYVQTNVSPKYQ